MDASTSPPTEGVLTRWLPYLRLAPWVVLLLGGSLIWFQTTELREKDRSAFATEFSLHLQHIAAGLEHRLTANQQILRGVVGLFAASDSVSRGEFHDYVHNLNMDMHYPGIQGVGFSRFIAPADLPHHTAGIRAEGFPDYAVRPGGERDVYSSIIYLEPFDWRNKRAFGYDMWSEPVRRAAMTRARDSGRPAMTAKVTLVQETDKDVQAGVLIYVPVYRPGMVTDLTGLQDSQLVGWAYSPLRMKDMADAFLKTDHPDHGQRLVLRIYDGDAQTEQGLLYGTGSFADRPDLPRAQTRIDFGGHHWTLVAQARPAYFDNAMRRDRPDPLLQARIALTLALALLTLVVVRGYERASRTLLELHRSNRSLAESEALLRTIYDSSSVAIFLVDTQGRITHANQRMVEMFLCPLDRLIGSEYVMHIHPDERETGRERMLKLMAQEMASINVERRYWREDGTEFWGLLTGRVQRSLEGKVTGLVGVIADITERRKGEAAMQLARTVFESSPEGIIVTDAGNRIVSVNPAFTRITGYRAAEVQGKDPAFLASGRQSAEFYRQMWQALESTGHWEGELWNRRRDGQHYPEMLSISRVTDSRGQVENYIAIFQDITARRQAEDRIRHLAHHDYLTGLPNRAFFVEHVAQSLALARRYERRMAVFFMDLDRFKPINDTWGHDAGDEVLKEVARRLKDTARESDMVCRQGGDEFLVLIPEVRDNDSLLEFARKLLAVLQQPIAWQGHSLTVSSSIGIATYPDCADSVDSLIQAADSAMYQAKAGPSADGIVMARTTA